MHTLLTTTSGLFLDYLHQHRYKELQQTREHKSRSATKPVVKHTEESIRSITSRPKMAEWQVQRSALSLTTAGSQSVTFPQLQPPLTTARESCAKVFSDPIHGLIELHPLMVRIIDTPQFQRLRSIKQLGGLCYVYHGASHNTFEHSIGCGYLAGELVESLRQKDHDLNITDQDVLSVKIAALCLDLGHGPFSHVFEKLVIPRLQLLKGASANWRHTDTSAVMFDYMVKVNKLKPVIKKYYRLQSDSGVDAEIEFIKSLIRGKPRWRPVKQADGSEQACQLCHCMDYRREQEDKDYLYEIVANSFSGIDVDKWDNYQRDCHHLGLPGTFDLRRPLKLARVFHIEDQKRNLCRKQACMLDKAAYDLYEMFHTRYSLQREAYQHPVVLAVEMMIADALVSANEHLKFQSTDGAEVTMYDLITGGDMYAYESVTDYITEQILFTDSDELEEARQILERIEKRDLYKCICDKAWECETNDLNGLAMEILSEGAEEQRGAKSGIKADDIIVTINTLDYGEDENPINHVYFYAESEEGKLCQILQNEAAAIPRRVLKDRRIRIYVKKQDPALEADVKSHFDSWYKKHHNEQIQQEVAVEGPPVPKRPRRPGPSQGISEDDGPVPKRPRRPGPSQGISEDDGPGQT